MLLCSLQDCSVSYSTHVTVPERFRKPGADPEGDCSIRLGLARFAAAMKPNEKQADIELCDLNLTYIEQPAVTPGMLFCLKTCSPMCLLHLACLVSIKHFFLRSSPLEMAQHDLRLCKNVTVMDHNE